MLYNKYRFQKANDKKVMHKVRKHWVAVSTALLMALGGGALTQASVHAAVPNGNGNNNRANNIDTIKESMNSRLMLHNNQNNHSDNNLQSTLRNRINHSQKLSAAINHQVGKQAQTLHNQILRHSFAARQSQKAKSVNHPATRRVIQSRSLADHSNLGRRVSRTPSNYSTTKNANQNLKLRNQHVNLHNGGYNNNVPGVQLNANAVDVGDENTNSDSSDSTSDNTLPSGEGRIIVRVEDVNDGDKDVSQSDSTIGSSGKKFDQQQFMNLLPAGYHFVRMIHGKDVTHYEANRDQFFEVGVAKNSTPKPSTIGIEFVNDGDGGKQIGDEIPMSDLSGQPFDISQFLDNPPNGFSLDPSKKSQNYIVENTDHITNTYIPGTHLIQIGIVKTSSLPKKVTMTAHYVNLQNKHYIGNPMQFSGMTSQKFSNSYLAKYEKSAPQGFNFVKNNDGSVKTANVPGVFAPNVNDIYIYVTPIQHNSTVNVKYVDSHNNQIGSIWSKTGIVGSNDGISNADVSSRVPQGYRFVKLENNIPATYTSNPQTVLALVQSKDANNQSSIQIHYVGPDGKPYNNGQDDVTVYNHVGAKFDPHEYENNVPIGFEFAKVVSSNVQNNAFPTQPKKTSQITIAIKPLDLYNDCLINVHYVNVDDNNAPITPASDGNLTVNGQINTKFDLPAYERDVPSGYQFVKVIGNSVSTFQNNAQDITIGVKPINNRSLIRLHFVDANNKPVGQIEPLYNKIGNKFNASDYENNVPSGYKFVRVVQGANVNTYNSTPQDVTIEVSAIPVNQPAGIHIAYQKVNQNGSPAYSNGRPVMIGNGETISGQVGNPFNLYNYTNVPSGYRFVNILNGASVTHFTNGPQEVIIGVQPIPVDQESMVQVDYVDQNGNPINGGRNDVTVPGQIGRRFDLDSYEENVPSGYKFVQASNKTYNYPTQVGATHKVDIEVQKIDVNQPSSIQIVYQEINPNGSPAYSNGYPVTVGSPETINGQVGNPFNLYNYTNVPSGYRFVSVLNGQGVDQFTNRPQEVVIGVRPIDVNQESRVQVNYVDVNGQPINNGSNDFVKSGQINTPFDLQSCERNVPSGYKFVKALNGTNAYPNQVGATHKVTIEVQKLQPSFRVVQMKVNYYAGTNLISSEEVNGIAGSQFNVQPYETNVPSGYRFAGSIGTVPQTFVNNGLVNLAVTKLAPAVSSSDVMTVNYVLQNHINDVVSSRPATGRDGTIMDIQGYENEAPAGYHVVNVMGNLPIRFTKNGYVNIVVAKDQQPTPKQSDAQMTVNYVCDGQTIQSVPVNGKSGQTFDFSPYMSTDVPQGYRYVGASGVPAAYKDGDIITVNLAKLQQNNYAHMTVNYVDNKGHILRSIPVDGKAGSQFNFQPYMSTDVPKGYHYVNAEGVPATYQDGDTVTVHVAQDRSPKHRHENNHKSGGNTTPGHHYGKNTGHHSTGTGGNGNGSGTGSRGNGSSNGNRLRRGTSVSGNSGNGTSSNSSEKLPQTGEQSEVRKIAAALVSISIALSTLGYAIDRKHRDA